MFARIFSLLSQDRRNNIQGQYTAPGHGIGKWLPVSDETKRTTLPE
jgi:hypothetical protein